MPEFLILIRRSKWDEPQTPYQGQPDAPANCLTDLRITDNELSVWEVTENSRERVLTALAANRELANVDYIIFHLPEPNQFGIQARKSKGSTPDAVANDQWHYDFRGLSVRQVANFVVEIHRSGVTGRIGVKRVKELVELGIKNGQIDISRVQPKLRSKLSIPPKPSLWERALLACRHFVFWNRR